MKVRKTSKYKKWIKKLNDPRARVRIFARIARLEEGNRGDWKPAGGNNVFEMRIDYGPGYRVYCKDTGKEIIILLCGGDKLTQEEDMKTAQKIALEPLEEEED
ncbi:addiction module antitoxin RelB [Spirochaetia bacterium]|nr:addiction module antitoxin RelB [Spirochaetia bacterium]